VDWTLVRRHVKVHHKLLKLGSRRPSSVFGFQLVSVGFG
jgi:hypothetical protein